MIKSIAIAVLVSLSCLASASAHNVCKGRGLSYVALLNCELRTYVHKTGKCGLGYREVIATQYGDGRHVASGGRYYPHKLTAAHRHLPFGTRVNVVNPHNDRSLTLTINDRGPATIAEYDLSTGSARALGIGGSSAICVSVGAVEALK